MPKPGAFEVLDRLGERGIATALVTNCAPDVPDLWEQTGWAPRFDVAIFSCSLGVKKPDPRIYREALAKLAVAAERTAFVGDGSDGELRGAADVGLRPVLVRNQPDLADPDVRAEAEAAGWPVVDRLDELPAVLQTM